ncbi:MAG: signal peptidase I, partial [Planctomycetota bacterium]
MLGPSPRRWAGRAAALGAAAVLGLHTFVVQVSVVRGHSMEPCLRDGDRLVVERPGLMHEVGDFGRFDVVILGNPREPSVDYVKRVVGLPGDRVSLRDGQLHIDDHPVPEGFAHHPNPSRPPCFDRPGPLAYPLGAAPSYCLQTAPREPCFP